MADITYELIAAEDSTHYVEFGLGATSSASFGIQMYIEKTGKRMVDWMQGRGIGFISFMGGEIWKHNSDNVARNNFFGEQKDMVVGIVFNEAQGEIKVMDAMGIHSNEEWTVDSLTIPATQNYPNGMQSSIPKGKFRKREGVLRAEFLRNTLTRGGTVSPLQALKGEPLRGYAAYMTLRNTSTGKVSLFKVDIDSTTSR